MTPARSSARCALLVALILTGATLRLMGLHWGLESGYGHLNNYMPDEFVSLRGLAEIDLLAGNIKAPGAYFEGTFNYYIWAAPVAVMRLTTAPEMKASQVTEAPYFARVLYACRLISVAVDLATVLVVFAAALEVTGQFGPAFAAATVYSVIPMQIIYSHYMRTHVLSNLLVAFVLWFSYRGTRTRNLWWFLVSGFCAGLGTATRYPLIVTVAIPVLCILFARGSEGESWWTCTRKNLLHVLQWAGWIVILGFVIGLFLGNPMLFLNTSAVLRGISSETAVYVPKGAFGGRALLDLSPVWTYVSNLAPFAMFPILWILLYASAVYVALRIRYLHVSGPIILFLVLYVYPMSKGYVTPSYARATMLFFPGLCVLLAVALADIYRRWPRRSVASGLIAAVAVFASPSLVFSYGYVRAMQGVDPRTAARMDLKAAIAAGGATTIGVSDQGVAFYTALPAAYPFKSETVTVKTQEADRPADLFLRGFTGPAPKSVVRDTVQSIESAGKFRLDRIYAAGPALLGRSVDLSHFPQDMTYPFPTVLLFRAKSP